MQQDSLLIIFILFSTLLYSSGEFIPFLKGREEYKGIRPLFYPLQRKRGNSLVKIHRLASPIHQAASPGQLILSQLLIRPSIWGDGPLRQPRLCSNCAQIGLVAFGGQG
jgi:hypothetical protein